MPRTHWHDESLWFMRVKRDRAAAQVPEWERLRELAQAIKAHALANLPALLEQFEQNATAAGATVHWARDAAEHNRIVHELLAARGATRLVKSKSMLTEECGLNPYLEARGVEVVDTDLGERIVQFRNEPPSHIVLPAIHLKKEEIGDLFHEKLGTTAGASDPKYLTEAARGHLRQKFLARRGRPHRRQLRRGRHRRGGGLHQRGERRHGHLAAAAPHRLHGAGEDRAARRGPRRLPAAAGPLRHRPAGHHLHRPTSTARAAAPSCTSSSSTTAAAPCWGATPTAGPSPASAAAPA